MFIIVNTKVAIRFTYLDEDGKEQSNLLYDIKSEWGAIDFINWLGEKGYKLINMEIIGV